jgi:hypothetical protein
MGFIKEPEKIKIIQFEIMISQVKAKLQSNPKAFFSQKLSILNFIVLPSFSE